SCMQHKSLVNANVLLAGPRDCTPEIAAASSAFYKALESNSNYLTASRYLFLRAARKLTLRFNQILWDGDDKLSKIASIISEIDELTEPLDFPHELPELKNVEKNLEKLSALFQKLESDFLYDSIPVAQIRNASAWARLKSSEGKKTIIIENADRMLESVRNALLKILEEPPEDTVFILTTSRRNAVMPTILSRVRTYNFSERTLEQQHDVISRVFHADEFHGSISDYLLSYLPVKPDVLRKSAADFFAETASSHIPDIQVLVKACGAFNPRIMLKLFLEGLLIAQKKLLFSAPSSSAAFEISSSVRECWNSVTVYNQSPNSALEKLAVDILKINKLSGGALICAD
ncbi:MAG: DNA polymerase III, partial [Treponema sp.]